MPIAALSPIDILGAALAELGSTERPISLDDSSSTSAKRARSFWPAILRELLVRHPWNFAIKRRQLNRAGDGTDFGFRSRYTLPEDCLRWLPPDPDARNAHRSEREGNALLSDAEGVLDCRYIALVDDTTQWSAGFAEAFTLMLAARMAEGVTQSEGIKDRLLERAREAIRNAKRVDGLETGSTQRGGVVVRSDWLMARGRRGYSSYR